eukprot:augustus_masked-scaffold_64-processed-gene-0.21-mRNA-1 protein AED:0.23 eAED:0.29 QI:0/-1/0/1/-1/1/1/0/821
MPSSEKSEDSEINLQEKFNEFKNIVAAADIVSVVEKVEKIFKENEELVNFKSEPHGFTPLMTCAVLETPEKVSLNLIHLLGEFSVDLSLLDNRGNSALHWAARFGKVTIIESLVNNNQLFFVKNKDGNTPFHLAAAYGRNNTLQKLIDVFIMEEQTMSEDEPTPIPGKLGKENGLDSDKEEENKSNPEIFALNHVLLTRNYQDETVFDIACSKLSIKVNPITGTDSNITAYLYRNKLVNQMRKYLLKKTNSIFKTGIYHSRYCLSHMEFESGGEEIWESPQRIESIFETLNMEDNKDLVKYDLFFFFIFSYLNMDSSFEPGDYEDLKRVHSEKYVSLLESISLKATEGMEKKDNYIAFTPLVQEQIFDFPSEKLKPTEQSDTGFTLGTINAVLYSVGAIKKAIDDVKANLIRNAFCIVRPPGHHAGYNGLVKSSPSCGFCIANNVVIGAKYALERYGDHFQKISIFDFDVHAGNGTEELVERINKKFSVEKKGMSLPIQYISMHLFDPSDDFEFYPGSGRFDQAERNIFNVPIPALWRQKEKEPDEQEPVSTKDSLYELHFGKMNFRRVLENRVIPLLFSYNPDLIILSAGFDGADLDVGNSVFCRKRNKYLHGMDLTKDDFQFLTRRIMSVATKCCDGKVISVLEGGYGHHKIHTKVPEGEAKILAKEHLHLDRRTFGENVIQHVSTLARYPSTSSSDAKQELTRSTLDVVLNRKEVRRRRRRKIKLKTDEESLKKKVITYSQGQGMGHTLHQGQGPRLAYGQPPRLQIPQGFGLRPPPPNHLMFAQGMNMQIPAQGAKQTSTHVTEMLKQHSSILQTLK